ncbi:MAG: putative AAA+ superfamily ATPase [Candidatus Azotimanducaceae bacterium]|jgi:predicted AAA+ superfamily ATPase
MNDSRPRYLDLIAARLDENPVVALSGPRQVGKTTLARQFAQTFEGTVHHFDLESPGDLARLSNPELALSPLKGLIILDEIQRVPELFPVLRVLADRAECSARFWSRTFPNSVSIFRRLLYAAFGQWLLIVTARCLKYLK